ncbi:prephenate dehydrogenase [Clostridium sp.]|uniref:prephenate dehydrogenase n=1 Tax=Clostridium sp. TaxID=1506 RepID=UPI003D6D1038
MDGLDFNITVVGLGLIGGAFAMALKDLKPKNLWGIDIDENTIKNAENMGIIDKGYINSQIPLKDSDIVIIALYPNLTEKFIKENNEFFKSGAIITDSAGIKEALVRNVNLFIREDVDFIGGHPMAGRESKGLAYASKDIFNNANYILTPTESNKIDNVNILECIIKELGCRNVVKIDPRTHDEIIAYTSHLPHIIAAALMNSDNLPIETEKFIAGGFKDVTRIADSNADLWSELLMGNADNIINKLEIFEENIKVIKNALKAKNEVAVKAEFESAGARRREM